jgi:predicted NBD/HSP70 family sugar kinase
MLFFEEMDVPDELRGYLFPVNVHEGIEHRVKDREKSLIFHEICTGKGVTRKTIVDRLEMRPSTVSNVVTELMESGLVFEGETVSPGKKGRPEVYLHANYDRFSAIAVYAVSRRIEAVIVNFGQVIKATRSAAMPENASEEAILAAIRSLVTDLLGDPACENTSVLGIGFSLPGNLNILEGRWLKSSRWREVHNIAFADVARDTGLPVASVKAIDADCGYILRRHRSLSTGGTLLVHWGYGIGASYAVEGRIVHPQAGRFGEIGHWVVDPVDALPCVCGDNGCLETRAALWALIPMIRKRYPEASDDETRFARFLATMNPDEVPCLSTAVDYIALALRNLYQLFYPDNIVLYGPFTERDEILRLLSDRFYRNIAHFDQGNTRLSARSLASEGEVYGSTESLFLRALRGELIADWGGKSYASSRSTSSTSSWTKATRSSAVSGCSREGRS